MVLGKNVLKLISFAFLASTIGCGSPSWQVVPNQNNTSTTEANSNDAVIDSQIPAYSRAPGEVAPGYLIGIKSPDTKVNGSFRIGYDNLLKLPYDVSVNTAGLTESQLISEVRSSYQQYFRSPSDIKVSILQKEYFVDVQGLVNKPGQYLVKETGTLDDLISQAGGLLKNNTPDGTARYARITNPSGTGLIRLGEYHAGANGTQTRWQGGEKVFFQSEAGSGFASSGKNSVHMLGQVKYPAEYTADQNADFYSYLIKAGGPTDRADLGNITVIRTEENQTKALSFDMTDYSSIPPIKPGDAIIVQADNPSSLEKKTRIGASFANIISALGIIAIAGR